MFWLIIAVMFSFVSSNECSEQQDEIYIKLQDNLFDYIQQDFKELYLQLQNCLKEENKNKDMTFYCSEQLVNNIFNSKQLNKLLDETSKQFKNNLQLKDCLKIQFQLEISSQLKSQKISSKQNKTQQHQAIEEKKPLTKLENQTIQINRNKIISEQLLNQNKKQPQKNVQTQKIVKQKQRFFSHQQLQHISQLIQPEQNIQNIKIQNAQIKKSTITNISFNKSNELNKNQSLFEQQINKNKQILNEIKSSNNLNKQQLYNMLNQINFLTNKIIKDIDNNINIQSLQTPIDNKQIENQKIKQIEEEKKIEVPEINTKADKLEAQHEISLESSHAQENIIDNNNKFHLSKVEQEKQQDYEQQIINQELFIKKPTLTSQSFVLQNNLKEAKENKIKSKDIFEIIYDYASNLLGKKKDDPQIQKKQVENQNQEIERNLYQIDQSELYKQYKQLQRQYEIYFDSKIQKQYLRLLSEEKQSLFEKIEINSQVYEDLLLDFQSTQNKQFDLLQEQTNFILQKYIKINK